MSTLKTIDKQVLEKLFQMTWYVLDFSDRTIWEFFHDELSINIFNEKYNYASWSKANRIRGFWTTESDEIVWKSILKMIEYIKHKIIMKKFKKEEFSDEDIQLWEKIAERLLWSKEDYWMKVQTSANISDGHIMISLQKDVFLHVQSLLNSGHYFNAVEESYKIVREKLRSITGKEKAHEWFKEENFELIFGHIPQNDAEKDFFEWVKFLHMAIQNLRNEKAHTPAKELDKNLAIHYIVLASLAYDLINWAK